jgi:hypothetical protein
MFFSSGMNQLRYMSNPLKVEAVQMVVSFNVFMNVAYQLEDSRPHSALVRRS